MIDNDEDTSILCDIIYSCKKFYNTGPGIKVINISLSMTVK